MRRFTPLLLLALAAAAPVAAPAEFAPGERWLDTAGHAINAHGGGFLYQAGTYYWFGEHKAHHDPAGVGCYSSADLVHWTDEGVVLTAAGPAGDLAAGCVIERPKVIRNPAGLFVMWFHLELKGRGYAAARAAVAVADRPSGPYRYVGSFRPNAGRWPVGYTPGHPAPNTPDAWLQRDFRGGQMSRDQTLFVDDDGTAYQFASSEENSTIHVSRLTPDGLKPTGDYARLLVGGWNEAPAVFKHAGHYYLMTSGTTGWAPNAARLAVADHVFGPWRPLGNPCVGPAGQTATTFRSQAASVLPVAGRPDAFVYLGDRWDEHDLPDSRYVWLPIRFDGDRPTIPWRDRWDLTAFDPTR